MQTVKKCIILGVASLAFGAMLVFGSDPSLRSEVFGSDERPAATSAP